MQTGAAAPAYDFQADREPANQVAARAAASETSAPAKDQQALFGNPNPGRVISFESLRSPSEQKSIRARAAEIQRPEPAPQKKVELKRAKPRRKNAENQQQLNFLGVEDAVRPPQSNIICDAVVAPAMMRVEAALIDGAIMLGPVAIGLAIFLYEGGSVSKGTAGFWAAVAFTIPVLYKLLWSWAGRDSIGLAARGLRLVDFDGNPPSRVRRYQRAVSSFISLFAAGLGLLWALVDEDALTWHDHMSSTFPTIAG